jgi:prevent-host-death family protein
VDAVTADDLRNHTAEVLRRVEAGEEIEVLRDDRPIARIVPLRRRQWLPASEVGRELAQLGPDTSGLAPELRETLTGTTDDLPAARKEFTLRAGLEAVSRYQAEHGAFSAAEIAETDEWAAQATRRGQGPTSP